MNTYLYSNLKKDFLDLAERLSQYVNFAKNEIKTLAKCLCDELVFSELGNVLVIDFKPFLVSDKTYKSIFSEIYSFCDVLSSFISDNQNLMVVFDKLELVIINSIGKISYVPPKNQNFVKPPVHINENDFYEVVLYIHLKTKISEFI